MTQVQPGCDIYPLDLCRGPFSAISPPSRPSVLHGPGPSSPSPHSPSCADDSCPRRPPSTFLCSEPPRRVAPPKTLDRGGGIREALYKSPGYRLTRTPISFFLRLLSVRFSPSIPGPVPLSFIQRSSFFSVLWQSIISLIYRSLSLHAPYTQHTFTLVVFWSRHSLSSFLYLSTCSCACNINLSLSHLSTSCIFSFSMLELPCTDVQKISSFSINYLRYQHSEV